MSSDGSISGTPTEEGTFSVTVTVTDSDGITATKPFSLLILPPVKITTTSLADGIVGVAYSQEVDATGGTHPYSWGCTALPLGLSFYSLSLSPGNSSSLISGTPIVAGTYFCTVNVTDAGAFTSAPSTDSKTFSLSIDASPLIITTTALSDGNVGNEYSDQVVATGGTPPYTWSATDLPPGLGISLSDGSLFGTPTLAGDYSPTFSCEDSAAPPKKQTAATPIPQKIKSLTLAGPTRIGQVKDGGAAKAQTYTVTVGTENDAKSVQLKKTRNGKGDVDISPPSVDGKTVAFTVKGTAASDEHIKNDVTLKATSNASPDGDSLAISVVIPAKVGTPHQVGVFKGITSHFELLDADSAPPVPPTLPALPKTQGYVYSLLGMDTEVRVVDQYNEPIGDLYFGAKISETFPINTKLRADSTYTDFIGSMVPFPSDTPGVPLIVTRGSKTEEQIKKLRGGDLPNGTPTDGDTDVQVDGFPLKDGIRGRQATTLAPDKIEITWPGPP